MNEPLPESDEQLAIKKRARRRLIGAIVFASFAAVVVPMLMDEEPPPATPHIELNIPAQEKSFVAPATGQFRTDAAAVGQPSGAPVAVAPLETAPAPGPGVALAVVVVPEIKESKPPVAHDAPVKPKHYAEAAPKPPVKAEPKQPRVEAPKVVDDSKRAKALLEGKAATSAEGGPHVILIGAFANPANVQTLQKKIGELGIRVYTEPLSSPQGMKTRVRAGPFANREAAERAAARIKLIGVSGVVAPKS